MSKTITKEDNTLTEEQILIKNERHKEAEEKKLDSYTEGRNAALSGPLLLRSDKLLTYIIAVDEIAEKLSHNIGQWKYDQGWDHCFGKVRGSDTEK